MHVFTPAVLELLDRSVSEAAPDQSIQLSPSLARLANQERYRALEIAGQRYNIGVKFGLLNAQLALGLSGSDREQVLAQLVEVLAQRPQA